MKKCCRLIFRVSHASGGHLSVISLDKLSRIAGKHNSARLSEIKPGSPQYKATFYPIRWRIADLLELWFVTKVSDVEERHLSAISLNES